MDRTVIGDSIEIDGEVSGEDPLVVRGRIKGRIDTAQNVVVERQGRVEAELAVDSIEVAGQVEGPIEARTRISITAEGRVAGDVRAPRVQIADGAHFKGHIDMDGGA